MANPLRCQQAFQVARKLKQLVRPHTGAVVVRDYAEGDLAELRLNKHASQRKLAENFYIRGDGTRCYYFSKVCNVPASHHR